MEGIRLDTTSGEDDVSLIFGHFADPAVNLTFNSLELLGIVGPRQTGVKLKFDNGRRNHVNLNEVLELIVLDEKEKFIIRKKFLLYSYLLKHKIVIFVFSENIFENPLIYNENLKLNANVINKIMNIDTQRKEVKYSFPYYNRLRIGKDNF